MSRKSFRRCIVAISSIVFVIVFVFSVIIVLMAFCLDKESFKMFKDLIPIIALIAIIPVALLTYCTQKRIAYVQELRQLWPVILKAVQLSIQYTYKTRPKEEDFSEVMFHLSFAIDYVRSVFKNINEKPPEKNIYPQKFILAVSQTESLDGLKSCFSKNYIAGKKKEMLQQHRGLYPFSSLKKIHKCISLLGHSKKIEYEDSIYVRESIVLLWGVMRESLLQEFDRDKPTQPESPFLKQDIGG